MDLAEFLLARIAEDESTAFFAAEDERLLGPVADGALSPDDHRGTHTRRWSPARVLVECDAKRRIVENWQSLELHRADDDRFGMNGMADGLEYAVTHLALPYADHPDYRDEWRP